MSGVEDSVENYQTYLDACCAVMVFESYEIHFVFVLSFVSRSLSRFLCSNMLSLTFFNAHTSLGCRKCLIGMLFDRKLDKLLSRTLYRTSVAAHTILIVRKDVMNDAIFAPLILKL